MYLLVYTMYIPVYTMCRPVYTVYILVRFHVYVISTWRMRHIFGISAFRRFMACLPLCSKTFFIVCIHVSMNQQNLLIAFCYCLARRIGSLSAFRICGVLIRARHCSEYFANVLTPVPRRISFYVVGQFVI